MARRQKGTLRELHGCAALTAVPADTDVSHSHSLPWDLARVGVLERLERGSKSNVAYPRTIRPVAGKVGGG